MNRFCTLFDSDYMPYGLGLYKSLVRTEKKFVLYIFCFDDLAYKALRGLRLKRAVLIPLKDFETEELLRVKKTRTKGEYCWTCTPFIIRYVLDKFNCEEVTYLDSDLFFFKSPSVLIDEFHKTNGSVLITEHRYTKEHDQTKTSGRFCVQFMTFVNDTNGLKVLQWWQDRCYEWCYARYEDGKFGDQKYLDCWPDTFEGVYILQNIGGGVAPWNIQQYEIGIGPTIDGDDIIFYHFHGLKRKYRRILRNKDVSTYMLRQEAMEFIYKPYIYQFNKNLRITQNIFKKVFCNACRAFDFSTIQVFTKISQYKIKRTLLFFTCILPKKILRKVLRGIIHITDR